MILSINELNQSVKRYNSFAKEDFQAEVLDVVREPSADYLDEMLPEEVKRGNIEGDEKNRENRKQMIESFGLEPTDFAFERAIGKNDSVYSNFVDLLANVKKKVGRIVVKDGANNLSYATGFMVSENLFMTNWHVFKNKASVGNSVVEFYYELDRHGNSIDPITFKFNSEAFFYAFKALDYCLIAVENLDVTAKHELSAIGYIYLDPTSGKLGDENAELLNIIHHPNGDYKQLSIRENKFTKILETTLWYKSDTAQGSSGSPVFNDQWQVVALHHMGVAKRNDQGDYLDRDNNVIPLIDNKIDISRIHWIANEGIRISIILKDLKSKFSSDNPYIKGIQKPFDSKKDGRENHTPRLSENHLKQYSKMETNTGNINIALPPQLLDVHKNINISISVDGNQASYHEAQINASLDELSQENKKIEREMDYSLCRGYQSNFLGQKVNLPLPLNEKQKYIAKIKGTDSYILNYFKFSVVHHSIRKMPFISAINVDGDEDKRKDTTERRDKWIRDNRIDFDVQLNNKFYKKSNFDRGHMSRREDANWGGTADDAKRNADLTCVHTNACPQVPSLNRSNRKGLWGKLENAILEHGAEKENDKTNKITVFSGPIFKDDDPVFRGVQIPVEFYKVIIWLTDDEKLKATAFKLSQVDLLDDINFESIDLDQKVEFKEYMCSLKLLQEITKIDFSHLFEIDTFTEENKEEVEIDSEEMLKKYIDKNMS